MPKTVTALAVLAALMLVACDKKSETPTFVEKAAITDMFEIEAGKVALEKGQADSVKAFAQHMVDDHAKLSDNLKATVAAEKLQVKVPEQLDEDHNENLEKLKKASAEDFDETYAEMQVKGHKDAVDLFETYAKDGDNDALKQVAANALPTIKGHLEEAQKLPQ